MDTPNPPEPDHTPIPPLTAIKTATQLLFWVWFPQPIIWLTTLTSIAAGITAHTNPDQLNWIKNLTPAAETLLIAATATLALTTPLTNKIKNTAGYTKTLLPKNSEELQLLPNTKLKHLTWVWPWYTAGWNLLGLALTLTYTLTTNYTPLWPTATGYVFFGTGVIKATHTLLVAAKYHHTRLRHHKPPKQ